MRHPLFLQFESFARELKGGTIQLGKWLLENPAVSLAIAATLYLEFISLSWRYWHDTPLMLFIGDAIVNQGLSSYSEIFDMNPPGTHLFHAIIVGLLGTSDLAIRCFDLCWLTLTQLAFIACLRRFGWAAAIFSTAIYTQTIYHFGSIDAMQREYICALPLVIAIYLALHSKFNLRLQLCGIGLLHGFILCIKPPMAISLPFLLMAMLLRDRELPPLASFHRVVLSAFASVSWPSIKLYTKLGLWLLAGFLFVPGLCAIYLAKVDSLPDFVELGQEYWPLYAQLRGNATVRSNYFETQRFWATLRAGQNFQFLILFGIGAGSLPLLLRKHQDYLFLILALLFGFSMYIFVSGKFWNYHNFPLYLVMSWIAGLALYRSRDTIYHKSQYWIMQCLILFVFGMAWHHPEHYKPILHGKPMPFSPDITNAAVVLRSNLKENDRVQPLAVTGGAVQAMLMAEARLATSFMYDFHFYHHISHPYIQRLRKRFLFELNEAQPEFIIKTQISTWRTLGPQSGTFPELESFVRNNYRELWGSPSLIILKHN